MAESNYHKYRQKRTSEISLQLRTWAELISKTKRKDRYNLLCEAADRLDELDERVAIMTEPSIATEEQLSFPPEDSELN